MPHLRHQALHRVSACSGRGDDAAALDSLTVMETGATQSGRESQALRFLLDFTLSPWLVSRR